MIIAISNIKKSNLSKTSVKIRLCHKVTVKIGRCQRVRFNSFKHKHQHLLRMKLLITTMRLFLKTMRTTVRVPGRETRWVQMFLKLIPTSSQIRHLFRHRNSTTTSFNPQTQNLTLPQNKSFKSTCKTLKSQLKFLSNPLNPTASKRIMSKKLLLLLKILKSNPHLLFLPLKSGMCCSKLIRHLCKWSKPPVTMKSLDCILNWLQARNSLAATKAPIPQTQSIPLLCNKPLLIYSRPQMFPTVSKLSLVKLLKP